MKPVCNVLCAVHSFSISALAQYPREIPWSQSDHIRSPWIPSSDKRKMSDWFSHTHTSVRSSFIAFCTIENPETKITQVWSLCQNPDGWFQLNHFWVSSSFFSTSRMTTSRCKHSRLRVFLSSGLLLFYLAPSAGRCCEVHWCGVAHKMLFNIKTKWKKK